MNSLLSWQSSFLLVRLILSLNWNNKEEQRKSSIISARKSKGFREEGKKFARFALIFVIHSILVRSTFADKMIFRERKETSCWKKKHNSFYLFNKFYGEDDALSSSFTYNLDLYFFSSLGGLSQSRTHSQANHISFRKIKFRRIKLDGCSMLCVMAWANCVLMCCRLTKLWLLLHHTCISDLSLTWSSLMLCQWSKHKHSFNK